MFRVQVLWLRASARQHAHDVALVGDAFNN